MVSARVPGFLPSGNGFKFSNSFPPGCPDVVISLPGLGSIPVGDVSKGICNGFVYAAMDLFLAHPRLLPPATNVPPVCGSTTLNYLSARLIDAFALQMGPLSNANRYLDFMSILDHDTFFQRGVPSAIVGIEWPQIKADIDAGRLVPIGLVGGVWVWPTNIAAKITMLSSCHSVLAYGYDLDDSMNLTLSVYDPNDPLADDSTIEMNIGNPTHSTPIKTPRITSHILGGETFRAFFKHQFYSWVMPPAGVSPGPIPAPPAPRVVTPRDFDADKKADIAVWRPAEGNWYLTNSATGVHETQQWGQIGDIPVPADYSGDGKVDVAIWRPVDGTWWIVDSATGAQRTVQWGQTGDVPVPADYSGDGKVDVAIWRPVDGTWWIVDSATGAQRTVQWGQIGDVPVPADYAGDGKADLAVWRPADGNWWIVDSATGAQRTVQWGQTGDFPV